MDLFSWNPSATAAPRAPIPVTVLSGFLGAGKTTVLNRILEASAARRFAVVVNDLGEVNIDASLIKSAVKTIDGAFAGMMELKGGCICCSIQTDLLDALFELSQRFEPEHILVEATGVAEPKAILKALCSANFSGLRGTDFFQVANMVTVVDAGNLEQYLESSENSGGARRTYLLSGDKRRPLQELMMEQIECADLLLINKADELSMDELGRFKAYLRGLNHAAEIWSCRFGQIDVAELLRRQRFSQADTLTGAAWQYAIFNNQAGRKQPSFHLHEPAQQQSVLLGLDSVKHSHSHAHSCGDSGCQHDHSEQATRHDKDYGLQTYVFNARRPFVESRLLQVLRNGLPGVIRAKGFYWTEHVPDRVGLLSIAGKMLRADYLSEWWYFIIQRGEADFSQVPELVRESWLPSVGDRRQELVFIGIDLDRQAIEQALKDCFVDE